MTGTFKNEPRSWFGLLPVGFLDAPFLNKRIPRTPAQVGAPYPPRTAQTKKLPSCAQQVAPALDPTPTAAQPHYILSAGIVARFCHSVCRKPGIKLFLVIIHPDSIFSNLSGIGGVLTAAKTKRGIIALLT